MLSEEVAEAVVWHAVRTIASERARRLRSLLKPLKRYPVKVRISGEVDGHRVRHAEGVVLHAEKDGSQTRRPEAVLFAAGMLSVLSVRMQRHVLKELPSVKLDQLPKELKDQAAALLDRLATKRPKKGEVRLERKE